jgi:hypothetical protein
MEQLAIYSPSSSSPLPPSFFSPDSIIGVSTSLPPVLNNVLYSASYKKKERKEKKVERDRSGGLKGFILGGKGRRVRSDDTI